MRQKLKVDEYSQGFVVGFIIGMVLGILYCAGAMV